ncbi:MULTISPECIES: acetate--CoA ligase family protein [unclassified Novosphingobium]|uniref:acetate--CoA ligase family protein n=1 Tax=unclassified Novosphingobium TaxID=2644732 RepID=UPI001495005B|nr:MULTISPECIES: acetate--CoA ligase family protein [unclassified Novosphingobium]MBB3360459.1 acyl-CoA synthetase (NDP forming) [Novosphingobium sp. BK256]MBB3376841.1 acyl-CoA synthetase (NDP forming) [Novosphingobium sp. BK280]MBB3381211.1 acyl-CoA synthetase (NDP forming) [Novosphingobium sp. BK258]MBB3422916.1 acyl-CoA synthetase (NDP forming) [Novosphingobium sp. BK267]MBB3451618.1 acyl-CoA synthetase (NDP forming) [Novosphingobium sp. BK352]
MAVEPVLSHQAIARFLRPQSVAVVGASDKPGALGATLLSNLDRNGYAGAIYPVNPKRSEIGGRPCYASVDALPEGVDVAVLAIPRVGVLDAVRSLAARKAGGVVIFSAGFAEGGEEGLAEQREIARLAAEAGMVVEGPNCLGLVNYVDRIPLTFVETDAVPPAGRRAVGIVSQSGAMAAVLGTMLLARECGVSYSVSTGNEAASGVEDYVDWLVDDPDTHAIAMIVEQFRKPQRFLAAARRARAAGKPVVLLHPGKSSAARESAATHTGAMAGDYKLMRAMVARAGVIFAETLEELGDIAEIAALCPIAPSGKAAVLGESGAFKALTLDLAEELGLELAALHDEDSPELRAALPPFVPVSNPLDITAQGLSEPAIYTRTLDALLADDRVGTVLAGIIQAEAITCAIKFPAILAAVEGKTLSKPLIFAGLDEGAQVPAERVAALRAAGVPWFPTTERALRAITRLTHWSARDLTTTDAPALPVAGLADVSGVIPEYKAKQLLGPAGVAFPKGQFAATPDDAVAAADAMGYPVAMKAQAAALGHKSDAGGVILNLADGDAVRAAWTRMFANVAAYDAAITLDGVLIEAMGKRGVEMIVGAKNDPEWGPVVLAGFGGVTAEILQDVRLLTADLTQEAVEAELMQLKSAALLAGYRGSPALDVPALAALIVKVGQVLRAEPSIREIDLNPVILHPMGEGVVALDALMLVD